MTNKNITNQEENNLMKLSEQDEWISIGSVEERRELWKQIAQNTIKGSRKRISIAVNEQDLARLKSEALKSGIPYQTIVNNLIRKHVRPQ